MQLLSPKGKYLIKFQKIVYYATSKKGHATSLSQKMYLGNRYIWVNKQNLTDG